MGSVLPFVPRCVFDDTATRVMGEAFDLACEKLGDMGQPPFVREGMAKRIIEAARGGERDVGRLQEAALAALKSQEAELKLRSRLLLNTLCPVSKGPASTQQAFERVQDSGGQLSRLELTGSERPPQEPQHADLGVSTDCTAAPGLGGDFARDR
jgi:hypothetical protein